MALIRLRVCEGWSELCWSHIPNCWKSRVARPVSDELVQPPLQMMFGQKLYIQRIFKRLAMTLIRLRVCAGCLSFAGRTYQIVGNLMLLDQSGHPPNSDQSLCCALSW